MINLETILLLIFSLLFRQGYNLQPNGQSIQPGGRPPTVLCKYITQSNNSKKLQCVEYKIK